MEAWPSAPGGGAAGELPAARPGSGGKTGEEEDMAGGRRVRRKVRHGSGNRQPCWPVAEGGGRRRGYGFVITDM